MVGKFDWKLCIFQNPDKGKLTKKYGSIFMSQNDVITKSLIGQPFLKYSIQIANYNYNFRSNDLETINT